MGNNKKGFTLVEIMVVVTITGTLLAALYMGAQPYMKRSRDSRRISDILQYSNIIDTYSRNFDAFPSNTGSGGLFLGYCLSELGRRTSIGNASDMQFTALNNGTSVPPVDPTRLPGIYPCMEDGSYFFSRLTYGSNKEAFIIVSRVEMRPSGNYGTGNDLRSISKIDEIINAKKSSIPEGSPDQLFVTSKLR